VLELRDAGLYCPAGDFYIDPALPVDRAIITHAHSHHVRPGSRAYLTARTGEALLRAELGTEAAIQTAGYGETITLNGATVSLHPSGHMLGSAQVRIEDGGEVWVVSGDYKLSPDPTCAPFEPLRCDTFVTESTFALPIFRWPSEEETLSAIHGWWRANQEAGRTSVLFAHPVGKAQRMLALLDRSIGPIGAHEQVERFNRIYREQGVPLPATVEPGSGSDALILAPPDSQGTPWMKQWSNVSAAFVSGWMRIRGPRRRRSLDRGFVFSDHADWPALLRAIDETRAETVWVTHGFRAPLARWLEERGRRAFAVDTPSPEAAT
jgi:putative mRNA 3-end processing factor